MPEMTKAACECEYPCSCVAWRGQTFSSPGDLVDHLSKRLDAAHLAVGQGSIKRHFDRVIDRAQGFPAKPPMRRFTDGG